MIDPFRANLCMWCEAGVQLNYFACGHLIVSALFDEKIILPPLNGFAPLLQINWPWIYGFISEISISFQWPTVIYLNCISLSAQRISTKDFRQKHYSKLSLI